MPTQRSNLKVFAFAGLFLILLQGCHRTMYTPNMHNVPLLQEKKQIRSNITLSNFQMAYGLSDGIGIMLNTHYPVNELFKEIGEDQTGRKLFGEIGIGHFRKAKKDGIFEIYTGIGTGSISFQNRPGREFDRFSTRYMRYFVQPSIGLVQPNLHVALSMRYAIVKFYNTDTSNYVYTPFNDTDYDLSLINETPYHFIEPSVTFAYGKHSIQSFIQMTRVFQLNSQEIRYRNVELNFGMHIRI